jgi:hypothetical protein
MKDEKSNSGMDPLLLSFLRANDETEVQHHLGGLVADATPIVRKITKWGRLPDDAFQETTKRVIRQLWELRANRGNAITNYSYYVKVVASHVVKEQVREERPRYRSMVDGLRHTLNREPSLALWQSKNEGRMCGLSVWRFQEAMRTHSERLMALLDEPHSCEENVLQGCDAARIDYAELLTRLFHWLGHPILFQELVRIVRELKRVEDPVPGDWTEDVRTLGEWLPDPGRRPDQQAEWREFLRDLWEQIEHLPHLERLAYLLNFTAGDGQLEVFWVHGVATIRQTGAALRLTGEQFARLWPELTLNEDERRRAKACERDEERVAFLWRHLPLPDAAIAKMLGAERQKVINLRKAAANRLSRRLSNYKPAA